MLRKTKQWQINNICENYDIPVEMMIQYIIEWKKKNKEELEK